MPEDLLIYFGDPARHHSRITSLDVPRIIIFDCRNLSAHHNPNMDDFPNNVDYSDEHHNSNCDVHKHWRESCQIYIT